MVPRTPDQATVLIHPRIGEEVSMSDQRHDDAIGQIEQDEVTGDSLVVTDLPNRQHRCTRPPRQVSDRGPWFHRDDHCRFRIVGSERHHRLVLGSDTHDHGTVIAINDAERSSSILMHVTRQRESRR